MGWQFLNGWLRLAFEHICFHFPIFLRPDNSLFSFFRDRTSHFLLWDWTRFYASPDRLRSRISVFYAPIFPWSEIGQWSPITHTHTHPHSHTHAHTHTHKFTIRQWSPNPEKVKKLGGKTPNSKTNAQKSPNLRNSGPTPVARGGSGAKAPPLAARPKQSWQAGGWLHQCVLRNSLAGSFRWFLCPRTLLYLHCSMSSELLVALQVELKASPPSLQPRAPVHSTAEK